MTSEESAFSLDEQRFLKEHGGLREELTGEQIAALRERQVAQMWQRSLSVTEAAALIGTDPGTLREQISSRSVHAYFIRQEMRLPRWQFSADDGTLPHLATVLRAFPPDIHPMSIDGFMTTPDADLEGFSPAQWLEGGRDPQPVLAAAGSLAYW